MILIIAFLLQYLALLGFGRAGPFLFLQSGNFRRPFAWLLLFVSLVLSGLAIGWQAGIPTWLGSLTLFGFVVLYAKAIARPKIHLWGLSIVAIVGVGL